MDKSLKTFTFPILIVIAILIIALVAYFNQPGKGQDIQVLSSQEVSDKVIDFINKEILQGKSTASLIEAVESSGLYKIKFKLEGQENEIDVYASLDGELFFPEAIELAEVEEEPKESEKPVQKGTTVGNFIVNDEEVCHENGKPIIYFFGSERCGYCKWEHPIVEKVALKFGDEISFHNNMDTDADQDILSKYSTGGIPTMVFGCRYSRVGAGQSAGEEGEEKNLTALICKLTDNKPADVCSQVQDLVNQITD